MPVGRVSCERHYVLLGHGDLHKPCHCSQGHRVIQCRIVEGDSELLLATVAKDCMQVMPCRDGVPVVDSQLVIRFAGPAPHA